MNSKWPLFLDVVSNHVLSRCVYLISQSITFPAHQTHCPCVTALRYKWFVKALVAVGLSFPWFPASTHVPGSLQRCVFHFRLSSQTSPRTSPQPLTYSIRIQIHIWL